MSLHAPEKCRMKLHPDHPMYSDSRAGNNGAFQIGHLRVVCSDGEGWEHVSVSTETRCPMWEEMCKIKHIFWDAEDCVIQYHPPKSTYVNCHPYCLHMWRPIGKTIPLPDPYMVGPRTVPAHSVGAA